ncbi:hypothetical protein [Staphylococcus phage vB_StaM_SA1]|nr:hypothetical protein [Staphylococcus phage vB_StaM_SA1]
MDEKTKIEIELVDYLNKEDLMKSYYKEISEEEKAERLLPLIMMQEKEQDESKVFENIRRYEVLLLVTFQLALNGKLNSDKLLKIIEYYKEKNLISGVLSSFSHNIKIYNRYSNDNDLINSNLFIIFDTLVDYIKTIDNEMINGLSLNFILEEDDLDPDTFLYKENSLKEILKEEIVSIQPTKKFAIKHLETRNVRLFNLLYQDNQFRQVLPKKLLSKYAAKSFK